MKFILFLILIISFNSLASPVGMSTYPLGDGGGALSAAVVGYMNQRREVGTGLRFTQNFDSNKNFDLYGQSAQEDRSYVLGSGIESEFLSESVNRPRFGGKAFIETQKFADSRYLLLGGAPTVRKGWSVNSFEFFTYLGVPMGMKLNNDSEEFNFFAASVLGYSSQFPGLNQKNLLLSVEAMVNMGQSDDALTMLISWMWN